MGTSFNGKNLLPGGANSSIKSSSYWYGQSVLPHKVTALKCVWVFFITHVRFRVMVATPLDLVVAVLLLVLTLTFSLHLLYAREQ